MRKGDLNTDLKLIALAVREYMMKIDPAYGNIHVDIRVCQQRPPLGDAYNVSYDLMMEQDRGGFQYTALQEATDVLKKRAEEEEKADATPRDT